MTDANALTGSHLAIIGNSGSGKSYAIRRLLEDSWGQATQIVFDVEDEFHTLRQDRPYVLVGGCYADIPLSDPGALARRVISAGISVIIQLNDKSITDRQRFIAQFLEALLALPRPAWRRALIVIDEADKYVPQGGVCESSQPIINLMAQGRKRGFIGVLATQRAAKINKSAVSECSNWMIGRVGSQSDRRVAADQLGLKITGDEIMGLSGLGAGQFWVTGPGFGPRALVQVPVSRTRHLRFGETWSPPGNNRDLINGLVPELQRPVALIAAKAGMNHGNSAAMVGVVLGFAVMAGAFFFVKHLLSGLI